MSSRRAQLTLPLHHEAETGLAQLDRIHALENQIEELKDTIKQRAEDAGIPELKEQLRAAKEELHAATMLYRQHCRELFQQILGEMPDE